jgi:hypothetical protein
MAEVLVVCPRCDTPGIVTVECRFGDTRQMTTYQVGDRYGWRERKAVQNGGRPADGHLDGDGYTVCPHCRKDFFTTVVVRNDHIQKVDADPTKAAYIS